MEGLKPWREYVENILVAVFLALLVRSYVLTGYKVPTGSMAPTLRPGDFIFAYKPPHGFRVPFSKKKNSSELASARRNRCFHIS